MCTMVDRATFSRLLTGGVIRTSWSFIPNFVSLCNKVLKIQPHCGSSYLNPRAVGTGHSCNTRRPPWPTWRLAILPLSALWSCTKCLQAGLRTPNLSSVTSHLFVQLGPNEGCPARNCAMETRPPSFKTRCIWPDLFQTVLFPAGYWMKNPPQERFVLLTCLTAENCCDVAGKKRRGTEQNLSEVFLLTRFSDSSF